MQEENWERQQKQVSVTDKRIGVEKRCCPSYINAITSENNTTATPASEVVSNLTQLLGNIKEKQNFRELQNRADSDDNKERRGKGSRKMSAERYILRILSPAFSARWD